MRYHVTNMRRDKHTLECDVNNSHFCFPYKGSSRFWKWDPMNRRWKTSQCGLPQDMKQALVDEMNKTFTCETNNEN